MTDYTPTTEDIEDGYKWLGWDEEFKPHQVSSEEFKRWLQKVRAETFDEGYEAGAEDQAECEGHRYQDTPEMRKLGFDHWTINPYES